MSPELSPPGIGGLNHDSIVTVVLACFASLIYYNAIELIVLCLATFKRRGSFYFWCLVIASTSLIPNTSGYILLFFRPDISRFAAITFVVLGWYGTVTGHSLVLWSRLNFVVHNTRLLNGLLVLIIVDAIILHVPTTVLLYGTVSPNESIAHTFSVGYGIAERIQLVGFCIQEAILSGIYVWETAKLLRLRPERRHHRILAQLLAMNVVVLIIDFVVVIVEYAGFYAVQVMFKPVAYSIKLKLEYAVLGRLVQIAQGGSSAASGPFETIPSSSACDNQLHGICLLRNEIHGLETHVLKRPAPVDAG
ncbi:hypothetical protein AN0386.2 [Aspergillus nidulans FGSC A4]|uniref:DUF7703 domain-containing protein n=1 Tax=Emericella nidulans (strain FGSC A4 / ATCC 38163 / CBS 112.46 / NRRL 194 / M139) TaxID=227321 RepID=Q5BGE4_EMENI|nr:hypothetical protein [Aspergillus nidulans FGSC A4]EAA66485.1 hypothetical protein AN0386.2 [Aspergillus nidulans FGSC A4]CBF89587.1 TPA: conserved hypothetical protein [Aspergillus nidulans FGSC A4]|eukprot:XP_657990.1 hypothetical protein AN0386.2 [Aspergillus nidulans FGSC A4]